MNVNKSMTEAVLGIDIGGTKVLVGLVSRDGQILASEKRPVPLGIAMRCCRRFTMRRSISLRKDRTFMCWLWALASRAM